MRYKIGDVSKILGISPDLLRYYEKKGVVRPVKDKHNDYRYYDAWDINILSDCLWFKNFGFSIEQIADIVRIPSAEELSALFLDKEEALRETIRRCQLLLRRSEEYRADIAKASEKLGRCEIAESPELVRYINRYTQDFDNSAALQKLSQSWLNLMPFTHRCFEIDRSDLLREDGKDYKWGFSLTMDYVRALGVDTAPPVTHLMPRRSIYSVFKSRGKGGFSPGRIRYMVDYARENGHRICGSAVGNLLASILEGDALAGYFEVWIPIE